MSPYEAFDGSAEHYERTEAIKAKLREIKKTGHSVESYIKSGWCGGEKEAQFLRDAEKIHGNSTNISDAEKYTDGRRAPDPSHDF